MKARLKLQGIGVIAALIVLCSPAVQADPLSAHLKRLTSALSSRNLDSLRLLIDPSRIYVEIAPKEGAYLTPSQTLAVIESFFTTHPPLSFSYILVKEEGDNGIALGSLASSDGGKKTTHRVNFGFKKNSSTNWLLIQISIH
jgi:hypothetical protein